MLLVSPKKARREGFKEKCIWNFPDLVGGWAEKVHFYWLNFFGLFIYQICKIPDFSFNPSLGTPNSPMKFNLKNYFTIVVHFIAIFLTIMYLKEIRNYCSIAVSSINVARSGKTDAKKYFLCTPKVWSFYTHPHFRVH